MLCRFTDQKSGYSVVFDDDGRVAYAYLLNHQGNIISDVWLYNQCKTPKEPEWKTSNNMPFANSLSIQKSILAFLKWMKCLTFLLTGIVTNLLKRESSFVESFLLFFRKERNQVGAAWLRKVGL